MKSIKTIIGALLLTLGAISVASCSQEEDNAMMQEKGNLLKIRTSVADTRGVITGTTFQKGDEIGICVTTVDGHDYTGNSQNIRATYTGSDWQLERDVELTDVEAIVYAYYPYNANATDSVDIYLNPTTTPEQTDYLQGSCQGVSINNTTANIQFKHVLTRLTLAITKGANDVGEGKITAARIENGYMSMTIWPLDQLVQVYDNIIATNGKMCIKTGGVRCVSIQDRNPISLPVDYTCSTSTVSSIDFLLFPFEEEALEDDQLGRVRGGTYIVLTIDGAEYRIPFAGATAELINWKAGQQYTYPITINRSSIPIPDSNGHEGVDMGILSDNGNTLYWGTYNIGGESIESYGELYCWGDPTGEKISADYDEYNGEYDFFPEDISGTEYDIAHVMWGGKWRIPTETEWKRLLDNSTIEQDAVLNTNGTRITSNINGNSIFLPSAGYYQHQSSTYGNGSWELSDYASRGAYWSSTRDFQHSFAATFSGGVYSGWRAPLAGRYSVRAVIGD